MKATQQLHELGQSLWLDNITRGLLSSGTLARYIRDYSVTGLTSNPTIFDKAIRESSFYDAAIQQKAAAGKSVWVISCGQISASCAEIADAAMQAGL